MGNAQASPLAIVIAIVVLLVVLFVIFKLTMGKKAAPTGDEMGPDQMMNAMGEQGGQAVPAPAPPGGG